MFSSYYCMFFNQMVHSLVKETFNIPAPTLSLRITMIIKNRYSKDSILKCCCPSSIDSFTSFKRTLISCLFEHDFRFLSKKNYTPFFRGLCKIIPLYARNDVTLCKTCNILRTHIAAQGMYWRILLWKQTLKNMLKFVCWFCFQVLAVLYFLPGFQVTFCEGAQTMRKSAKKCAPGWCPWDAAE